MRVLPDLRPLMYALMLTLLVLVPGGCHLRTVETGNPSLTFAHMPKIMLKVQNIEVNKAYVSPYETAAAEAARPFPVLPGEAVERWAQDRLKAAGHSGLMRLTIKEAALVEKELPRRTGLMDFFYIEPSERYEVRMVIVFDILGVSRALPASSITVEVNRGQEVKENASVAEREALSIRLVEQAMQDFNAEAERQIHRYFATYLYTL